MNIRKTDQTVFLLGCFFPEIRFQLLRSESQNFPISYVGKILRFTSEQLKPNLWKSTLVDIVVCVFVIFQERKYQD